jgi:hemolysin activation/secretion protein
MTAATLVACLWAGVACGQGAEPRFEIKRFSVEGAQALGAAEMEGLLAPLTGPGRGFADLQRAREIVEAGYARRGYRTIEVVLPPQEVQSGVVRLQVIEQKLGRVKLAPNQYFDDANVRASLPALREGELTDVRGVNRSVRAANENPAKQTAVTFERAAQPGTVDAAVKVSAEEPLRWFASIDNSGTPQTGKLRVAGGVRHANVANSDHVLNFQYVTAPNSPGHANSFRPLPNKDVTILGLGYRIPLYAHGDSLEFVGGYSNVNSGTLQNLFNVSGSGSTAAARYHLNLDRIGNYDQRFVFSADWRNYRSSVLPLAGGASIVPDITLHPLSLTYTGTLAGAAGQTALSLGVSRNLPGGGDGDTAAFGAARAGADAGYSVWRYGVSHFGLLRSDVQWRAALEGQWTRDLLVPGEQFGLGGANSVRGFSERELADDRGLRGVLELYSPDYGGRFPIDGLRLRLVGFYDAGSLRRVNPTVLETARHSIASVGLGTRIAIGAALSLRLDYGVVIDAGGAQSRGDGFLHASMAYLF